MATVIVSNYQKTGLSVSEQKCYLQYEGKNDRIIECLDKYQAEVGGSLLWVVVILILITSFFIFLVTR